MTATVVPTEVAAYLAAVREALSDLGADERDDLLVEVEASLIETAGEDDRPISVRLGLPADFAAELRASAGLEPAAAEPAAADRPSLLAAARAAVAPLAADPRVRAVGRVLAELAPIWWLGRAYVAVVLLGAGDWSVSHPAVPRIGNGRIAVVVLAVAVAVSIALGLRERRRDRKASRLIIAVNLILAVAAVPAAVHLARVTRNPGQVQTFPVASPALPGVPGLATNGLPVRNIYPYTRGGVLLHDVLLYDDTGQPLQINPGDVDPTRRVLTGPGGQRIFNSFPIRYFAPGTARVVNPAAAPALLTPSLFATPATRPAARRAAAPRRSHR